MKQHHNFSVWQRKYDITLVIFFAGKFPWYWFLSILVQQWGQSACQILHQTLSSEKNDPQSEVTTEKKSFTIPSNSNAAATEQEIRETDLYAWRVREVRFRTLRVIERTVANSTTWRPDCQTARVEQVARPVTIFCRFVYDLSRKTNNQCSHT